MGKKKRKLQIRIEQREAAISACQRALLKAKQQDRELDLGKRKRKDTNVLARYVCVSLHGPLARQTPETFGNKSYNLSRQVLALIDHVFTRYPVPAFLYRCMLSREGLSLVFDQRGDQIENQRECGKRRFVRWFVVAAQGGSLAKEMKDILTKKEVHWFLQAPVMNSIQQNIFWAKCAAAGIPLDLCQTLTEHLASKRQQMLLGARTPDLIRFYATESQHMRGRDQQEITDFVRAMILEPSFSFKGRTHGSMVKLSHDWHQSSYSTKIAVNRIWPQSISTWTHEKKDHKVVAIELTSSRALADEGRKQRHCVYSYETDCLRGWSKIVSFRWIGPGDGLMHEAEILNRITVEVSPSERTVVQIRARCNRKANDLEMKAIRLWAGDNGLRISEWA